MRRGVFKIIGLARGIEIREPGDGGVEVVDGLPEHGFQLVVFGKGHRRDVGGGKVENSGRIGEYCECLVAAVTGESSLPLGEAGRACPFREFETGELPGNPGVGLPMRSGEKLLQFRHADELGRQSLRGETESQQQQKGDSAHLTPPIRFAVKYSRFLTFARGLNPRV